MSRTKIHLVISGGGLKAAYMHLGVMRGLAELDRWRDIEEVHSVGSGSLVGALYGQHLSRRGGDPGLFFENTESALNVISSKRFRALDIAFPALFRRRYTRLVEKLFGDESLNSLGAGVTQFSFSAMAFHSGRGWLFRSNGSAEEWDFGSSSPVVDRYQIKLSLSDVVLASSDPYGGTFGGLLNLRRDALVPWESLNLSDTPMRFRGDLPEVIEFTSGDLIDPTGIAALLIPKHDDKTVEAAGRKTVFSVGFGRAQIRDVALKRPFTTFGIFERLPRIVDISMAANRRLSLALASPPSETVNGSLRLSLSDFTRDALPETVGYLLRLSDRDLDWSARQKLMEHGRLLAHERL